MPEPGNRSAAQKRRHAMTDRGRASRDAVIRKLHSKWPWPSYSQLAKKFGLTVAWVSNIVNREKL